MGMTNKPYDCSEKENVKAFRSLPPCCQHFIRTIQNRIQQEVDAKNPGRFKPTSGFRAQSVNIKYNGSLESSHRLGMARDFVPVNGLFTDDLVVDTSRFKVLRSSKCWHVTIIV